MIEWRDAGLVLATRPHGETSLIVSLLTMGHGRHLGLVRGGRSRRYRGQLEPGNRVLATWRARLSEHLGNYTVELERDRAGRLLDDPLALQGLAAACVLAEASLAEREAHPRLYEAMDILLDSLEDARVWPALTVRFELGLLAELGFGLDLASCAVTGSRDNLTHVSPRTGHAVSAEVAAPYGDRLLRLPAFLLGRQAGPPTAEDVLDGLALTGTFLARWLFEPQGRALPEPRVRLPEMLRAASGRGRTQDASTR